MRTDVFLVGAFSSAGAAGETGVSLVGSGLVFTSALGSSLAAAGLVSALGVVVFVVAFLAVVVRLRVVVLAVGLA